MTLLGNFVRTREQGEQRMYWRSMNGMRSSSRTHSFLMKTLILASHASSAPFVPFERIMFFLSGHLYKISQQSHKSAPTVSPGSCNYLLRRWDGESLGSTTRCTHYKIRRQLEANWLALLDWREKSIGLKRTWISPITWWARRLQQRQEQCYGTLPHFIEWLSYACEGWSCVSRQRDIIETNE